MTTRRTALIALLALAASAGSTAAQAPQRPAGQPQARTARPERQVICRGAAIPTGWLLVDNLKDRSMCGGENSAVYNAYNVWAIERHDNRPAGSEMTVCASAQTPAGWTVVDVFRQVDVCGHPSDPFIVNVKRIRKSR